MDPELQQLAGQITKEVTATVNQHVTEVVTAAEERLTRRVRAELAATEQRLSNGYTAAEERLSRQAQMNVEAVKEEARIAADGYGGTVQSINDRLGRIESDLRMEQKSV